MPTSDRNCGDGSRGKSQGSADSGPSLRSENGAEKLSQHLQPARGHAGVNRRPVPLTSSVLPANQGAHHALKPAPGQAEPGGGGVQPNHSAQAA